jgi:hypothetical protein
MSRWFVILLATLAVALLLGGLSALILPEDYEGQEIYRIDRMHVVRAIDMLGGLLLAVGCIAAWAAGLIWQHRTDAR